MKNIFKYIVPVILCMPLLWSCSKKMDDYLKYTDGPRQYTGKVDSVVFRSGEERVVFNGLLTSDPKIKKVIIYWNVRNDSIVLNVNKTSGVDTLVQSIPLPEGRYNFEIISLDGKGIPSIPVNISGSSYGESYKSSLYNRPIKEAEKVADSVIINWYSGDETSPFVKIDYTGTDNNMYTVKVPTTAEKTVLNHYKSGSKFQMQAYYLPDETAIDTFKAPVQFVSVTENITSLYLKNYQNPIQRGDAGNGKWGLPKDWSYNSNVVNQNGNTGGGWSWDNNGCIHFETQDWGGSPLVNGKVYQTITLPEGNYKFECESGWYGGTLDINLVAAAGNTLPDITDLNNNSHVLGLYHTDGNGIGGWRSITFSLSQTTTVSIGWVVTTGQYSGLQFKNVKLWSLQQ